jgi:3-oxoacyl-[acyl-carrier-protein] synthase II
MMQALQQAGIDPRSTDPGGGPLGGLGGPPVQYISAHGTGTQENDSIETRAVKLVFGENAKRIPMSSIKSMMGHLIAAAGAVELITCVLAMQHQMLPPTRNLHSPDIAAGLDLDYVPNEARPARIETCLSNSFGFGGQNDTLIVTKF